MKHQLGVVIRNLKRVVQEDISHWERQRGVNYSHDLLWVTPSASGETDHRDY